MIKNRQSFMGKAAAGKVVTGKAATEKVAAGKADGKEFTGKILDTVSWHWYYVFITSDETR